MVVYSFAPVNICIVSVNVTGLSHFSTNAPIMRTRPKLFFLAMLLLALLLAIPTQLSLLTSAAADPDPSPPARGGLAKSIDEARGRARLLHETIHGTLQVMHRDFFDEDNAHAIPSASLEDVFAELAKSHQVEVRWLNVQTDVVNVDHQPQDEFEKHAVTAIAAGKTEYEAVEDKRFRYAGRIRLASQCLKCHVKHRTSTKDRSAGLLITIPVKLAGDATD
jgi:hypothetical protein